MGNDGRNSPRGSARLLALLLALVLAVGALSAAAAQDDDEGLLDDLTEDDDANETENETEDEDENETEEPEAAAGAAETVSVSEAEVVRSTFFSENQTLVTVLDIGLSGQNVTDADANETAENLIAAPGAETVSLVNATVLAVGTDEGEAGETEMRVRLVFEGVTTDLLGGAAALPPADNVTNDTNVTNVTNDTGDANVTDNATNDTTGDEEDLVETG